MVTEYKRTLEDEDDYVLHSRGWKQAGISLWYHKIKPNAYFTKEQAMEIDLSGYRCIEMEHSKMLDLLWFVANQNPEHYSTQAAKELMAELGYDL